MSGMVICIHSNYAVAASVLHLPDAFQSDVDSRCPTQSAPTLKETHISTQNLPDKLLNAQPDG